MKIIVIGGTGTIGKAVAEELAPRHEVLIAGRSKGDLLCDTTSEESIRKMFQQAGSFDAVVTATGRVPFEDFSKLTAGQYLMGLNDKLMGQVNVVRIGCEYIREQGSFTLVSGILGHDPVRGSCAAAMANGAIEAFVKAAAFELPKQIRINAICPTIIIESLNKYAPYFRGFDPVPVKKVALAFCKSIEGHQTGQIYKVL
ncbi:MAG: short chain dehydrogenase [Chlamydiales bacterium]